MEWGTGQGKEAFNEEGVMDVKEDPGIAYWCRARHHWMGDREQEGWQR